MKLCSRLLIVFGRNFWDKRQIWVSEPMLEKLGVTHDLGCLLESHCRLSICIYWFFRYLLRFLSYEAKSINLIQLGCFDRGRPLCTQMLLGQGRTPSTILGIRKLDGDCIFLRSRFDTIPNVTDRQTDGRICRSIYSACKVSFAARCKKHATALLPNRTTQWYFCS